MHNRSCSKTVSDYHGDDSNDTLIIPHHTNQEIASLSNLSTLNNRQKTPERNTCQRIGSTPTPTRTLRGSSQQATPTRNSLGAPTLSKKFSTSILDMRSVGRTDQKGIPIKTTYSSGKSQSGQAITIRRSSSRSSLSNHPVTTPKALVTRSQSVEPLGRPRPQDNLYGPSDYQNGNEHGNMSLFSFLNFGSPDPEGM